MACARGRLCPDRLRQAPRCTQEGGHRALLCCAGGSLWLAGIVTCASARLQGTWQLRGSGGVACKPLPDSDSSSSSFTCPRGWPLPAHRRCAVRRRHRRGGSLGTRGGGARGGGVPQGSGQGHGGPGHQRRCAVWWRGAAGSRVTGGCWLDGWLAAEGGSRGIGLVQPGWQMQAGCSVVSVLVLCRLCWWARVCASACACAWRWGRRRPWSPMCPPAGVLVARQVPAAPPQVLQSRAHWVRSRAVAGGCCARPPAGCCCAWLPLGCLLPGGPAGGCWPPMMQGIHDATGLRSACSRR